MIKNNKGETLYLNSGDWIENLTALEYNNNEWTLYEYQKDDLAKGLELTSKKKKKKKKKDHNILFNELLKEFDIQGTKKPTI